MNCGNNGYRNSNEPYKPWLDPNNSDHFENRHKIDDANKHYF